MPTPSDFYSILGVTKDSTQDEIKKSYRKKAMEFHPDRNNNPGAEAKFKEVKEAYETLSDESKKGIYDSQGQNTGNRTTSGNPFANWHNFSGSPDFTNDDLSDLYNSWRRREAETAQQKKTKTTITITLEQAYGGVTIPFNNEVLRVPPGVRTGSKLFVQSTIIDIIVQPHTKFKRTNDDLLVDIFISVFESVLGIDNVTLTHLDGKKFQFSIPKGLQHNQVIRLSKKGMPNPETSRYGDLMVRCNVVMPSGTLTAEQKEILEKLFLTRKSIDL